MGPIARALLTWATIAAVLLVSGVAFSSCDPWSSMKPTSSDEQCEQVRFEPSPEGGTRIVFLREHKLVRAPQDTWSNLGYLLAGLLVLFGAGTLLRRSIGGGLCLLALGSGLFHGSMTSFFQYLDVICIYIVLLLLLFYAIEALFPSLRGDAVVNASFAIGALGLGTIMGIMKTGIFESTRVSVGLGALLLLSGVLVSFRSVQPPSRDRVLRGGGAVIAFVLGATFKFFLDGKGNEKFCSPTSVFQGHAWWHVFSAAGLLLIFDYFALYHIQRDDVVLPRSGRG